MVEHPAKDPTCTSEGNIKFYTCTKCDRYFRRDESIKEKIVAKETSAEEVKISKKDHTPTQIAAKAATCTETGIKEHYKCSVCGKLFSDSDGKIEIADTTIPALGHDYGDPTWNWCGVSSATATFKCTRCGESQTIPATVTTRNEYSNCYVYTRYTATVEFNGNTYTNTRTDYSCRLVLCPLLLQQPLRPLGLRQRMHPLQRLRTLPGLQDYLPRRRVQLPGYT